ncbi:hypothetical protein Y1Q_0008472 [Alligator mississippiensis]|uniref:Uncharacterized protein n=1 Tax=Alligator mississippiensis TaxID=8496 RepID=A0A151M1F6_ALLMI|nr:hypothetical protein Y1Q_0008472 [Alligator mississippiensis]
MITYSDLKFDFSKHGDKVRQKEMTTYSELKFQNQAEQQRGRRFQEAGSRGAGGSPSPSRRHKALLPRWQCATVALGILCLVLLIATGVLSYLVTKLSQGKGNNSEPLTSCSGQQPGLPKIQDKQPGDTVMELSPGKGNSSEQPPSYPSQQPGHPEISEEQRGDTVMELSPRKGNSSELPPSCPSQQPGLPKIPDEHPGDTGQKCPAQWATAEGRSYLFSPEKGTWEHCKSSCMSQSARLLSTQKRKELGARKGHKQREQARCPFSSSSSELHHPPLVNGEEQDKDCLF